MSKMAIVGRKDVYLGFKALGLTVIDAHGAREAEVAVLDLAKQGFSIIFVSEDLAQGIMSVVEKFNQQPAPAIVMIPDHRGSLGLARERVRRLVEKAVGIDILAKERG